MTNKKRGYYTLKIDGKERVLHFSMNFWASFTESMGIELGEIDKVFGKSLSITTLRALIYSGAVAYDLENKNVVDYDIYDVGNWMESDINTEDLTGMVNCLTESRILGNSLNGGIQRGVQKTTKKRSVAKK